MKHRFLYALFLLAIPLSGHSPEMASTQRAFTWQDLKDVANHGSFYPEHICHEFGHALAAKALRGSKINIHLGAQPEHKKDLQQHLIKVPGITIHSFKSGGFATHTRSDKDVRKDVIITAAGPLCGIASYWLPQKIFQHYMPGNVLQKLFYILCNMRIIEAIRYGFTPLGQDHTGDGYKIWHTLGAPSGLLDKISSLSKYYDLAYLPLCLTYLLKKGLEHFRPDVPHKTQLKATGIYLLAALVVDRILDKYSSWRSRSSNTQSASSK